MRVHYFQHVLFEGLGCIEEWMKASGCSVSSTRFYKNDPLPNLDDMDWLIVMGGPMGANDSHLHPWLKPEKEFIGEAIERGIKVLGICLGAQLIASVLGANVYRNAEKEIGWFPLRLTTDGAASPYFAGFPETAAVFHWHGDTFDLPAGALHLAESAACRHQAFSYRDNVLALQFHLDLKRENVEALIKNCGDDLVDAPYIQSAESMAAQDKQFETVSTLMKAMLTAFERGR